MSYQSNKILVDVAMGRKPADCVIVGGKWVCVQSGEIIPDTDIAIADGRIAYVGEDAGFVIGDETDVIQADSSFMVPGLLDAHMHVESGMLTVSEFVYAVLAHGTTGMFIDPHEFANVFGIKGVRLMVDEAKDQPIHVWVQAPSCIPSAPEYETPGSSLNPDEVAEILSWQGVIGLGEVMDFPGVYSNNRKMHTEIEAARKIGKVVGGHYASKDLGRFFYGYAAAGIEDDHEGTTTIDALVRARQGMKVMMRFGSAWKDVREQVKAVTEYGLDSRNFLLCTDDCHAGTLAVEGHVDRALRVAIDSGVPPIKAIQMATINTAVHFGVDRDIGMIAPGRSADILLVSNLSEFSILKVIVKGIVLFEGGKYCVKAKTYHYPAWARESVKLTRPVTADDFVINAGDKEEVTVNVIGLLENQAPNRRLKMIVPVHEGVLRSDIKSDLAKIGLLERHHGSGIIQVGFVSGFGFDTPCAVASTVAHDCHHLLVSGTSDSDMAIAVNRLKELGGGQIVVCKGKIICELPLPIGGLMSDQPAEIVAKQTSQLLKAYKECGCELENPNMLLSLAALVVIPDLRISDKGLVDVNEFKFISLIESEVIKK